MTAYVTDSNGNVSPCNAKDPSKCRFHINNDGSSMTHYSTRGEALRSFEDSAGKTTGTRSLSKNGTLRNTVIDKVRTALADSDGDGVRMSINGDDSNLTVSYDACSFDSIKISGADGSATFDLINDMAFLNEDDTAMSQYAGDYMLDYPLDDQDEFNDIASYDEDIEGYDMSSNLDGVSGFINSKINDTGTIVELQRDGKTILTLDNNDRGPIRSRMLMISDPGPIITVS